MLTETESNPNKKIPRPVMLMILDGWGVDQPYPGNAIAQAKTPVLNGLIAEYPAMTLRASGEAVGIPWGEAGNSEVGHINLGLGRILYQDLPRINRTIGDGSIYENKVLLEAIAHAKKNNSKLHFLGVVSNGCVHASIDHLYALLLLAKKNDMKDVYIHAILDGRDTSYNSGINFIKGVERSISEYSVGEIVTISGRYYAMDRNNNWDRIEKAYAAMVDGIGNRGTDPVTAVKASYDKKVYDEEFVPTTIAKEGQTSVRISDNDAVVFYNFRPDRARQLTQAFVDPNFNRFARTKKLENLYFATFTEYEKDLVQHIVFPAEVIKNALGDVLSAHGKTQLRIAETEKYAHVTYFFNGGREELDPGEKHILVPSLIIPSYDQAPEMSAGEITKKLLEAVNEEAFDFILVNYANADMIGHTGNINACIKGVEFLDACVGQVVEAVLGKGGAVLITADHGNAEVMFNMQTGQIDKEHTSNPVPFIVVAQEYCGRSFGAQSIGGDLSMVQPQGILSDIAPTVLKLMSIEKPKEMAGISLI